MRWSKDTITKTICAITPVIPCKGESPLPAIFFISGDFMESNEQYKLIGRKKEDYRQKDDFYPTPEYMTRALLVHHKFDGAIWECACGVCLVCLGKGSSKF